MPRNLGFSSSHKRRDALAFVEILALDAIGISGLCVQTPEVFPQGDVLFLQNYRLLPLLSTPSLVHITIGFLDVKYGSCARLVILSSILCGR